MHTRKVMKGLVASGSLFALLIGCSTSVDGVDEGDLGSTQQALYNGDICDIRPDDPSCDTFGDPAPAPPPSTAPVLNRTAWRIEHLGWQLSISAPFAADNGTVTSTSDDRLKATLTMVRTSTAPTTFSGRGFGGAIVRRIAKPGGTINSTCTKSADCFPNGSLTSLTDGSYRYCEKVGTATSKTCVERPAPTVRANAEWQKDETWASKLTPATTFTLGGAPQSFAVPDPASTPAGATYGAPYGTTATTGGGDYYTSMAVLNVTGQTPYKVTQPWDGVQAFWPPCAVWWEGAPGSSVPYMDDTNYCVRLVRPTITLSKWSCGDGVCNGAETQASCADCASYCGDGICNGSETSSSCGLDCCPAYCAQKPWLSGCNVPGCMI